MKRIEDLLPPEEFIKTYGIEELRKTQRDPLYFVSKYLADPEDVVTSETIKGESMDELHVIVTRPNQQWTKFKFGILKK